MKKAAIFPFHKKLLPIARHFHEMQSKYELTELIALPGMGLAGKDAGAACNQPDLGIRVLDELDVKSDQWDTLLLMWEYLQEGSEGQSIISDVLSCGKDVVILVHKSVSLPEWPSKEAEKEKDIQIISSESFWKEPLELPGYDQIYVPVILVGGIIEEADVLEVTVAVSRILQDMGCVVATITKEAAAGIFGFLDLEPLYSGDEEESEKIQRINRIFQIIEKEFVPDIIVMEAPDAMIRYNDLAPNGFGIRTYMLCQAVQVDMIVCCVPYDLAQNGFVKMLDQDFQLRFGAGIGMVHASNAIIDSSDIINNKRLSVFYDFCDRMKDFINREAIEADIPVCNVITQTRQFGVYLQRLLENEEDVDEK